jgi:hypothetical protein
MSQGEEWRPPRSRHDADPRPNRGPGGIDPVHFGLVFVLPTMIGLITPPGGHRDVYPGLMLFLPNLVDGRVGPDKPRPGGGQPRKPRRAI